MTARIRPAIADDVPAMTRLAHAAYEKYVARIGKPPGPMLDDYAALVRDGRAHVLEAEGTLAGLVVLLPQPDHLLLDNVAVAPAQQGRGIGRALLAFAEDEARRSGFAEIRLYTNEAMAENLPLYRRCGYEETHRAEQAGYRRVFMRKRLG